MCIVNYFDMRWVFESVIYIKETGGGAELLANMPHGKINDPIIVNANCL